MISADDNDTMSTIFPTPIRNPMADRTWGEPEIVFHDNSYFLIYDTFPVQGGPACLMTSPDGVHWREEGAVLWPENPICIECVSIRRYQDDGPFVLSYDAHVDGRPDSRFRTTSASGRSFRTPSWRRTNATTAPHRFTTTTRLRIHLVGGLPG